MAIDKYNREQVASKERRYFLGTTTVAGIASAMLWGPGGCARIPGRRAFYESLDEHEFARFIARIDKLMEEAYPDFVSQRLALTTDNEDKEFENYDSILSEADALSRKVIQGLSLLGMHLELTEDERQKPAYERYLEEFTPELDFALLEMANIVATCPEQNIRDVERVLERDPDFVMSVCESLDTGARQYGLGREGRRRLRSLGRIVTAVCSERHLATLVTGCVSETERIAHELGIEGAARDWYSASLWTQTSQLSSRAKERQPRQYSRRHTRGLIISGGVLMGIGVPSAVSLAVVDTEVRSMATIGGVLFLVGLILLLVGLSRRRRMGYGRTQSRQHQDE